ncbi:hypothetical protein AB0O31_34675 [Kitasatospora cineracea]|uniref:MarR family protein n=1 Tax=Kitasatospora cineracea TaxID=88074 RepID=A0A3N4R6I5_9ACTN|nr:hypothetical protein [Kitasatospora cineracea]RPE26999.1 hypothetical protein EDD38_7636 [Kitasatospora cineracea]
MLIQSHLAMAQLYRLGLSKAAYDVLSAMAEVQHPGGEVNASQAELAASVGLSKNRTSIAVNQLVERHVVLRPEGRYRSYKIHPLFAGYTTVEELESGITSALCAIQAGDLPEPSVPAAPAPARHLAAVPSRQTA